MYHGLSCKLKSNQITSKEIQANSPVVGEQTWEQFLWTLTNKYHVPCIEHEDCTETSNLVYPDSIDRMDSRAGRFGGSLGQRGELLSTLGHREHEGSSKELSAVRADRKVKAVGDKDTSAHSKNVLGHLLHTASIFGPDDWKPISCWAAEHIRYILKSNIWVGCISKTHRSHSAIPVIKANVVNWGRQRFASKVYPCC